MPTSQDIRDFYEDRYRKQPEKNPAFHIYDDLRVKNIRDLARSSRGPVLIVGCGSDRDYTIVPAGTEVYAFDLSFEAVRNARANEAYLFAGDALNVPAPAGTYGLVICSEVLEHIPDIHRAVSEMRRVLRKDGVLIVSSPNWISWFGLARWVSERLTKKKIHSDDQPYDDWKTLRKYTDELAPQFEVAQARGVWYLPPLHFRKRGAPAWLTRFVYLLFSPFERLFSRLLPGWGHMLVLKCTPK